MAMEYVFHVNEKWLLFGEFPQVHGREKAVQIWGIAVVKQKAILCLFLKQLAKKPPRVGELRGKVFFQHLYRINCKPTKAE